MQANPTYWFWLIVSILTVWRLTTLLCYESGPFNLVIKLRKVLYRAGLGSLLDCFHCTAFWIAVLVTLALYQLSIAILFLAPATAGGASIIEKVLSYYFITINPETNNEND